MPEILSPLFVPVALSIQSPGRHMHALTKLHFACDGPPDMRCYRQVVHSAAKSLRHFLRTEDITDVGIWQDLIALEKLDQELQALPSRLHPLARRGIATKYPAWDYLSELTSNPPEDIQVAIGAELVISHILKRPFRANVIRDFKKALSELEVNHEYKRIATRLKRQAHQLIEASKTQTNAELQIYVRVQATLSSQLHPMRIPDRQDAGTVVQLSDQEALAAAKLLKENAIAGCTLSLQIIIAFCLGIVWDVALDIPFAHLVGDEWIAHIDITTGLTRIDLTPVLPTQAKGQLGHVPSKPILVRPLVAFAQEILQLVASKSPDIKCIRDINQTRVQSHISIPGAECRFADRLTIAKVIGTRGRIAKLAGLDAATAAYATCDLTKVGRAKHSYITFKPDEIWDASEKIFDYLGWGRPVPLDTPSGVDIGSSATPSAETAKAIDTHLIKTFQKSKAGNKYTLDSLVKHHNAYTFFCVNRIAFFESARLADSYSFLASDYPIGALFGRLDDKSRDCFMGKNPVPIPVCVATQISLWLSNLKILHARLEKLGIVPGDPIRTRIQEVLTGASVPLFFQILNGLPVAVGSADIKRTLPSELKIKFDGGRHFVQNAARREGMWSPWVDAMERHHTAGTALSNGMANAVQVEWLSATADAIDRISMRLGFFPVVGLGK